MFLDLLAGGGLLAAGYVVGYLTARTVHRRSAGQEDCTCGHSVSVHDQSGAPSRSSVRSNGKSTGSRSTGAMWHVPASGTSAPECRTSLKSTALNAVNNPPHSLEAF